MYKYQERCKTPLGNGHKSMSDFGQSPNMASGEKISRNKCLMDKGDVRRTLEDRFKNFYESSGKPNQIYSTSNRAKTPIMTTPIKDYKQKSEIQQKTYNKGDITPKSNKSRSHSTISNQCSQCSGSAKKGMEYICLNCINQEMANGKHNKMARELEKDRQREYDKGKIAEAEKKKYEQELLTKKKNRIEMYKKEIAKEEERQRLKKKREYFISI